MPKKTTETLNDSADISVDLIADLEATLDEVAEANPRISSSDDDDNKSTTDLRELLEASLVTNSSLVLEDVLELVMRKAIDLMQAERGFIVLIDKNGELEVKSAYNLDDAAMSGEEFKISNSVARQVIQSGKSVYTSDALADDRYSHLKSVVELHLRSIMCVPITVKEKVIGVIYLDNSSQSGMFVKSDLYVFEMYAQLVANTLHNAGIYDSMLRLKSYNESVVANSPVGIVVIDSRCRIATINAAALEIFDLNADGVTILNGPSTKPSVFLDMLPESQVPRWQHMISTASTTQQEFSDPRFFHNTGYLEKALSVKITPISELPSGDDGLILIVEDITEKVLMEKYVILSEKLVAKGEMAASVAHELNNFLAIVSNNAELLTMNIEREKYEKADFNARAITENIMKIKRFVNNLMDFSKPEPDYISYDLKHLIEDLLFSLRAQPRFKQTHFTIDLNHDIPNLEIDVGQIQQVLLNFLNNAADAIEDRIIKERLDANTFKREVVIGASYDPDSATSTIAISDNGIGMSEETIKKIFTVHFTTKKSGHGLGLANCVKIVENHHGEIQVESTPGKGSTFKLILPRTQPKKAGPSS